MAPQLDPNLYTVAWVAPLGVEAKAAACMLDHKHEGSFPLARGDNYVFQAGDICGHNVVIATFPVGDVYGTGSAAALASRLKSFFPNLWFGLLVGIAAGLPDLSRNPALDIRLGDVLVALPEGESPGIVPYDLGTETRSGEFELFREGYSLDSTEAILRSMFGVIRNEGDEALESFLPYYDAMKHLDHNGYSFLDPGQDHDQLFQSDSDGVDRPIRRETRPHSQRTRVWYGPIGSGEKLVKSSSTRRALQDKFGIIGLEMEAAGTMNQIPMGVIRGVSDYGDRHKNKGWQPYAAAMAAAYAKGVLSRILPVQYSLSEKDRQCLDDLLLTDPGDEMLRIEQSKGGLLQESCRWVLETPEFKKWHDSQKSQLLWIKGDAGKGKTMLTTGIIDTILKHSAVPESQIKPALLAYFIFQRADSRLNDATGALRGLMYLLVNQQPSLIKHLRVKYDHIGVGLFDGPHAFYSLSRIFQGMLLDVKLPTIYLILDGLDECETGLQELLGIIIGTLSIQSKVKWIVSSRNRLGIDQFLANDSCIQLSLELNSEHVESLIKRYIDHKVSEICSLRNEQSLREQVRDFLYENSDGTFLWIASVFGEIKDLLSGDILDVLEQGSSDLNPQYDRMIEQIRGLRRIYAGRCFFIISVAIIAYRPLHIGEIQVLSGVQKTLSLTDLEIIISMCGSFLTFRKEHVYLIHRSANDYLLLNAGADIFPNGCSSLHRDIAKQLLSYLSKTLSQNIYNLPDYDPVTEFLAPDPDPLAQARYACIYWWDHIAEACGEELGNSPELSDEGIVLSFFGNHFLHWLESLSLIWHFSNGLRVIRNLLSTVLRSTSPKLFSFLEDADSFIVCFGSMIEQEPLQVYGTALELCPTESEIRKRFWGMRVSSVEDSRD